MKIYYYVLTICLIFVSFEGISSETTDRKIELTQKQVQFAKNMLDIPAFKTAEWQNTYVLYLTLPSYYEKVFTKSDVEELAFIYAVQGYVYTEKDICIKISYPEKEELAYKCVGHQTET